MNGLWPVGIRQRMQVICKRDPAAYALLADVMATAPTAFRERPDALDKMVELLVSNELSKGHMDEGTIDAE